MNMYDDEREVSKFFDVPAWIDQNIQFDQVAAINEGGCASGAYMPAVTYEDAQKTMNEYGDDVLQFIDESGYEISGADLLGKSWAGMACMLLSTAVELWAMNISDAWKDITEG
jgi:ketosteroid isomerase-like protein